MPIVYPFTTRSLAVPFLPRPTTVKDQEVSRWGSDLTLAISRAFDALATRIEEMATTSDGGGGTGDAPQANRSRSFYYDGTLGDMYFDNGSWVLVASLKSKDHSVTTAAFGGILTPSEDTVQKALDKIDDHNHDSAYISIIGFPAANHFPYQTAGGELIDSGYDAADFAAAGHNHDLAYLKLSGGTMSGDITFANAKGVYGKETGGTPRSIALVNASNEVEVGNATTDTRVLGDATYMGDDVRIAQSGRLSFHDGFLYAFNGTLFAGLMGFGLTRFTMNSAGWECYAPQDITFANAKGVRGYNLAEGTAYNLALVNASNQAEFGSTSLATLLQGTSITTTGDVRINGANALQLNLGGVSGVYTDALSVDTAGSTSVLLGNTTYATLIKGNPITSVSLHKFGDVAGGNCTELQTDGDLIQTGTAKIDTAASAKATNVWASDLQATKTKTLSNNTAVNLFKWGSAAAAGASMHFRTEFLIQVQYTYLGTTYYWTRGGTLTGTILHLSASLTKAINPAVVWDGAGIAFSAAGVANTPTMNESVTLNSSVAAADVGPVILVNLNTMGYTFVSAYVHYTVISTDVNHTAWTGAFV